MKTLHQIAIEPFFMPKRQTFNLAVQSNPQSQMPGSLKSFSGVITGADTGLTLTDPGTPIASNALSSIGPTANQIMMVQLSSATPYIGAALYDSAKNKITTLTISGALAASATASANCSLVYSSSNGGAWYLKSGGENKVYPLTLSGTTLTVGTAIDISGSFATAANCVMAGNGTTGLFLYDNVANVFKKFTLSGVAAGSFGAALTNPTAGFQTTNATDIAFAYSNGKIYFAAPGVSDGRFVYFYEYSVAGNSWSSKSRSSAMLCSTPGSSVMCCDPASNTYVYFFFSNSAGTNIIPQVWRWISATDTWEYYCALEANGPASAPLSGAMPASWLSMQQSSYLRSGFYSSANGDIGIIGNANSTTKRVWNVGSTWGRQTIVNYTGSGVLLGVSAPVGNSTTGVSPQTVNYDLNLAVTVDGGTERLIHIGGYSPEFAARQLNIIFNTSLRVDIIGSSSQGNSGSGAAPGASGVCDAFVNITS